MLLDKIQLEAGETILKQTRRHWFILASQLAGAVLIAMLPIFLYMIASLTVPAFTIDAYAYVATYFYAVWLLFVWVSAFGIWTNYYLDILTITDRRLILVNQRGLFKRSTGSFRLERLQDINVDIDGMIATFLDYGTVQAQTAAGDEEEFRVYGIPNPREIRAIILQADDKLISERRATPLSSVDG